MAQRYGTIAAHTRRRASVLVVFLVFCVHMYSFAGLVRWTPPPTFSDTAITDRHSDTTIFQLRAHLDRENRSDTCPWWESNSRLPACKASTLSTRPGSPLCVCYYVCVCVCISILVTTFPEWYGTHCRTHPAPCVRPRLLLACDTNIYIQLCQITFAQAQF